MAWANIQARPGIFIARLADGVGAFASNFPETIWRGYLVAINEPPWLFRNLMSWMCLIGLLHITVRRAKSTELAFWALVWTSIAVSASVIYFDDGSRTLAASHPLMALFFALG